MASLDPRLPVGDILAEPLRAHGCADGERHARASRELLQLVGLAARAREPVPAGSSPAGSGSASASPARWRSSRRCWCSTSRCRRSTCRSRPASSTCSSELRARARPVVPVRRARPRGGPAHRRPRRRDVPRPDRRDRRRATRCSSGPRIRTRRRCCRRSRCPIRGRSAAAADRARGRPAEPGGPAVRLPLPHALPEVRPDSGRSSAGGASRTSRSSTARGGRPASPHATTPSAVGVI